MNKTFTQSIIASQNASHIVSTEAVPSLMAVKMLIRYSQALQVIRFKDFTTCYLLLN